MSNIEFQNILLDKIYELKEQVCYLQKRIKYLETGLDTQNYEQDRNKNILGINDLIFQYVGPDSSDPESTQRHNLDIKCFGKNTILKWKQVQILRDFLNDYFSTTGEDK